MTWTSIRFRAALAALWLAAVVAPQIHAQGSTVTLAALEQQALASRQTLAARQARLRGAAAEVERRRSAMRPSLELGGSLAFSPGGALERVAAADLDPAHDILVEGVRAFTDRNAFAPQARYGAVVSLTKSLYDFGRTSLAIEAARAEEAAATADHRAARRQVLEEVRGAYLTWLAASELAAISDQAVADALARLRRVQDLVREGLKPAADITPVASDEALARLDAARARADVESARIMLDAAVGGGLPLDARPDGSILRIDQATPLGGERRPEVSADAAAVALERQSEAARATASLHERQRAPVIATEAQLGLRAQNPLLGDGVSGAVPVFGVGLSVRIPLADGGSARAMATVARAQADELAARALELTQARQTARRQAEADGAAAELRRRIARELLALSDTRVRDAEERYELAGGRVEAIADATAMRRRASLESVLAEIAAARARFTLQDW